MAKNKKDPKDKIDLKDYEDPEGLSLQKLSLGLWIVKNKKKFLYAFLGILILVGSITLIYTTYSYVAYYVSGRQADEDRIQALINTNVVDEEYRLSRAAQDLIFSPAQVIKNSHGYDFVTRIKNPNSNHFITFDYCFVVAEEEIDCQPGFIYPEENKFFLSLSNEYDSRPQSVSAVLKNIKWYRINAKNYPDWPGFINSHLDFAFEEVNFISAANSGLSNQVDLSVLEFTARNNTAYSYWQVPLTVILYNGNSIVGVNRYILDQFSSGDNRMVRMVWPTVSRVSEVLVLPDLDVTDQDVFMSF